MRKGKYLMLTLGLVFALGACNSKKPADPTTTAEVPTEISTEVTTEAPMPTTEEETTEPETEPIEIVITTEEVTNGADAKLDTVIETYANNNISIRYPKIVGLHADKEEKAANEAMKKHVLSILEQYEVNEETDTLELDHQVLTLYRGQISVLYLGSLTKAGSMESINLCFADNINLITGNQIRLNSRYSVDGLKKLLSQSKDYEIISANTTNFSALKDHLAGQPQKYYDALIANGDFGGDGFPTAFSYNNGTTLHIIILVPHILGDYVELTAVQKVK